MINKESKFQSSINIRFDLGNEEFVNRFFPTHSHIVPFQGVLQGLKGEKKAHILSGPYGSGKSLIGTILAGVISKRYDEQVYELLIKKFESVDDRIGKLIDDAANSSIDYIPVILEGDVSNLRISLLSAINKALKQEGIHIILPGMTTEILEMVKIWENQFPETYSQFQRLLNQSKVEFSQWIYQVENYNEEAIELFIEKYPSLTSGATFIPQFSGEIDSQMNFILSELNRNGKGLFVVHDEFGRFLQALNSKDVHSAMQDLQKFAEIADHNSFGNMNFLLITHKNLRQYAHRFTDELQMEFQRIEKRFSLYNVESDQATFVRISNLVTQNFREKWSNKEHRAYLWDGLTRFDLFPELSQFEKTSLIIDGCYPMHPITLYCMPKLANIVAQNERTLFTFLESNEMSGLKSHFEKFNTWYTPDMLFDYFEPSFDEFEHDSIVKKSYLLFKRLQKRLIPSNYLEDQLKILKLLTLWDISNLNLRITPNLELISFSLMLDHVEVEERLEELYKLKVLRHLNDENRFILYEGSIIDVNKEIENRMKSASASLKQKLQLAEDLLDSKYYLPKLYNDEKSITRFAKVSIVHYNEIHDEKFMERISVVEADFHIIFIITDNDSELERVKTQTYLQSSKYDDAVFVFSHQPASNLLIDLEKLHVIEKLEQDKVFLLQDHFMLDELQYIKRGVLFNIRIELEPYFEFSSSCDWIFKGECFTVSDERTLSNKLSNIMFELYPYTPEFRNEAFNRRNIAKVQEKNAYKVMDKILDKIRANSIEEALEISGFGPDYLINATILKNQNINPLKPELILDESLLQLRKYLLNVIKKERGSFTDLITIFLKKPFAIRKPLIPLLLPALLGKEWKYLLFYNNGMYIQSINGEGLWRMVQEPGNYSFAYQSIEGKYNSLVEMIENSFGTFINEEDKGHQTPVYLSKTLVRWYQSLPRLARITNKQTAPSNLLREIVRVSEVRPLEAIEQLYELINKKMDEFALVTARIESEQYIEEHKNVIEKIIFNTVDIHSFNDLKKWAGEHSIINKKKSKLLFALLNSESVNYIDKVTHALVGVNRNDWSDATDEVFQTELMNELSLIQNQEREKDYIEVNFDNDSIVIPKLELSTKSRLIYDDISRKLKYTGRTVTKDELLVVLWRIMQEVSTVDDIVDRQEKVK